MSPALKSIIIIKLIILKMKNNSASIIIYKSGNV